MRWFAFTRSERNAVWLGLVLFAVLIVSCGAWHAFIDVETLPTREGTTLNSEVTLPTIITKELVCRSSIFRDSIGQSCGNYEEAPNQMCVTEEARKSCCACGGGEITPENSETGEECQSAITSLETVLVVCRDSWNAKECSRDCVAAWNSLIRDVETMVGQKCVELEIRMNSFFPKTFSGDSTFGQDELVAFATCCVFICPVDTNYCGLTPHPVTKIKEFTGSGYSYEFATAAEQGLAVATPENICPSFKFTDGVKKFSVLSWHLFEHYTNKGWGCSGGLAALAGFGELDTENYRTWACIYEPSCKYLALSNDWVCYKYAHRRGEFHFWGLNSALKLVVTNGSLPGSSAVSNLMDVSFCDFDWKPEISWEEFHAAVTLKDALDSSRLVKLSEVDFKFTRDTSNGEIEHSISGPARNNGNYGCGPMRLYKNSKYYMEITAGPTYYPYSSFIYTPNKNEDFIVAAMMPIFGENASNVGRTNMEAESDRYGISLSWGIDDPEDLDLYLFQPGETGETKTDQTSAVYWNRISALGKARKGDGNITRKEYNAGFEILDKNSNGFVSKEEFGMSSDAPFSLIDQNQDQRLSRMEWEAGFDFFDKNGDGVIIREEFNGSMRTFIVLDADGAGSITRNEYNAGFDIMDANKNGFVTRQEFGMWSDSPFNLLDVDKDKRLSRMEWEAGFVLFDMDGDGFITREEFNGSLPTFDILDTDGGTRGYGIRLQTFEAGKEKSRGQRESMVVHGDLPVGTYALMVHVHKVDSRGNPDANTSSPGASRFHGGGATVSFYSAMLGGVMPDGKFSWTVSPEDHLASDWWHVFNLKVTEVVEQSKFGVMPRTRLVKKVTICNVNKMVRPGLLVNGKGVISGSFPVPCFSNAQTNCGPHSFSDQQWLDDYTKYTQRDWRELLKPRGFSFGTELLKCGVLARLRFPSSDARKQCCVSQQCPPGSDFKDAIVEQTCAVVGIYEPETQQLYGMWLEFIVVSASDGSPVENSLVTIIEDELIWAGCERADLCNPAYGDDGRLLKNIDVALSRYVSYAAKNLELKKNALGKLAGGLKVLGRFNKVLVTSPGYFPKMYDIDHKDGEYLSRTKLYAVPDDGLSRVVLTWKDTPRDADIYLVAKNVTSADGSGLRLNWMTNDRKTVTSDPPYVYFAMCTDFESTCTQPSMAADGGEVRVGEEVITIMSNITLTHDANQHGTIDARGMKRNGPETLFLEDLNPGKYLVFANAGGSTDSGKTFPTFDDYLDVEIFLGNGNRSMRGPKLSFTDRKLKGGTWFFAGYFHVTADDDAVCDPKYRDPIDASFKSVIHESHKLCYTYEFSDAQLVKFTVQAARDTNTGDAVPNVQYRLGWSSWLSGVGRTHDPYTMPTVIRFQAPGYELDTVEFDCFGGYATISWPKNIQAWMVKKDALSHFVLRWGDFPADLDMYLKPLGVRGLDEDETPVEWFAYGQEKKQLGPWVQQVLDVDPPHKGRYGEYPYRGKTDERQSYVWYGQKVLVGEVPDVAGQLRPELSLDRDDLNHSSPDPSDDSPWPNGPEAMTVKNLLPGAYELYVSAYDSYDETQTMDEHLRVEVYLGNEYNVMSLADSFVSTKTIRGGKWLFMGKLVVLQVTSGDECSSEANAIMWIANKQPPHARSNLCYAWFRDEGTSVPTFSKHREYMFQIESIQDVATSQILSAAKYKLDELMPSRVFGRVHRLVEGTHRLQFSMPGYVMRIITFSVGGGFDKGCEHVDGNLTVFAESCIHEHWVKRKTEFLVPNDGRTRIILRWGDRPADLDTYVVPSGVKDLSGNNVYWKALKEDGTAEAPKPYTPYVYWGLCSQCDPDCECNKGKTLVATANAAATQPLAPLKAQISLDRDDRVHGVPNEKGIKMNGPETTTFQELLPGRYDVYFNVYEAKQKFEGGITVETYLGDGITSSMVDSFDWELKTGRWFYAGYIIAYTSTAEAQTLTQPCKAACCSRNASTSVASNASTPPGLGGFCVNVTRQQARPNATISYTWVRTAEPMSKGPPGPNERGPGETWGDRRRRRSGEVANGKVKGKYNRGSEESSEADRREVQFDSAATAATATTTGTRHWGNIEDGLPKELQQTRDAVAADEYEKDRMYSSSQSQATGLVDEWFRRNRAKSEENSNIGKRPQRRKTKKEDS